MLHRLCVEEEAGARNLVFFRVKWLQATMKGTSCVRRVRLRSFCPRIVPPMCFATSGFDVAVCVVLGAVLAISDVAKLHWNGCFIVAWASVLGMLPRAPDLVFLRVKLLQPTMKAKRSSVRRVRLRSFCARIVPPMCLCNEWVCP